VVQEQHAVAGQILLERRTDIAEQAIQRMWERFPHLRTRYGEQGREKSLQDMMYHVVYLAEAVRNDSPRLFVEYVRWVKVLLNSLKIDDQDLVRTFQQLRETVEEALPADARSPAVELLDEVLTEYTSMSVEEESFLPDDAPHADLARRYMNLLLNGKRHIASRIIVEAVDQSTADPKDIYLHVFQPVQHEIGRLWQTNKITVAQEHYCTASTQLVMCQLYPYIFNTEKNGRVFIGVCVGNELHELGIRMVTDFFEMEGWDTYFLGANTPAVTVVQSVRDRRADVVGISTTMTYHLDQVRRLIGQLRSAAETSHVKVLVGGYPFNADADLWQSFGADGFAGDAVRAVQRATELVEGSE
jgi:methanogenic corrinoid protein MtbC1